MLGYTTKPTRSGYQNEGDSSGMLASTALSTLPAAISNTQPKIWELLSSCALAVVSLGYTQQNFFEPSSTHHSIRRQLGVPVSSMDAELGDSLSSTYIKL